MPKYSYFCKLCDEPYDVRMPLEEPEVLVPRCPNCGDEGKQELFAIGPDAAKSARGGCCGGGHGCCG